MCSGRTECDLGGKDAVYELSRAWMKDADIKSNFAQSLVWHYYKHRHKRTRIVIVIHNAKML